jgi:hypothetical protein
MDNGYKNCFGQRNSVLSKTILTPAADYLGDNL